MKLIEVMEEITERLPSEFYLSPESLVRKVTQVRDRLIRNYGPSRRQFEPVVSSLDIIAKQAEYPLPCPPGNVVDVEVMNSAYNGSGQWVRFPQRQFNDRYKSYYYYLLAGTIGIYPAPEHDVIEGMKIFHVPVLADLTVENTNTPTGFDPDFDMLLVYGVLNDVTTGPLSTQYYEKFNTLLDEYIGATNGYERYVVEERW